MKPINFLGRLTALALALLLICPGIALAGGPVGRDAFVIADQPVDTLYPSVAYNSLWREYMVVWQNDRPANDDLYGQILSRHGNKLGGWFAVAAGAGAERRYPDVAFATAAQEYLVVWEQETATGTTIRGQRFRLDSAKVGGDFLISATAGLRTHERPRVAYAWASGLYLVVWESHTSGSPSDDILGQMVNPNGTLSGTTLTIVQGDWSYSHGEPDLAYNLARNEFLVAWIREDKATSRTDIYARRVTGNGVLLHPPSIQIEGLPWDGKAPAVAAIPRPVGDGRYLVAWQVGTAPSDPDIYGRVVTGDGTPTWIEFVITNRPTHEFRPAAAGNESNERFLVSWIVADMSLLLPEAREVGLNGAMWPGVPVLGQVFADHPAVASGPQGDFLVVFDGQTMVGNVDIHGRLWGNRIYLPMVVRQS